MRMCVVISLACSSTGRNECALKFDENPVNKTLYVEFKDIRCFFNDNYVKFDEFRECFEKNKNK